MMNVVKKMSGLLRQYIVNVLIILSTVLSGIETIESSSDTFHKVDHKDHNDVHFPKIQRQIIIAHHF